MSEAKLTIETGETRDSFFRKIESLGGWPLDANSVVSVHGSSPYVCHFSKNWDVRDEWNTTRYTKDDYHLWKLSERALNRIRDEGFERAIRILQDNRRPE